MLMFRLPGCLCLLFLIVLCPIVGCAPEMQPNDGMHEVEPPKVVAQRVARTVNRQAERLVRIDTEHERFVVTPEHPFATPGSGWIQAGRLVPGAQLVSARFGTVRVLSVQNEKPTQRVPVFNLGVDPSHTYLVGADQVLVHNTTCKDADDAIAEKARELAEAEGELAALETVRPKSAEHAAELEQRIVATKARIQALQADIRNTRKRKTPEPSSGERSDTTNPNTRTSTSGTINASTVARSNVSRPIEAQIESVRKALEAAQSELRELEGQLAGSDEAWTLYTRLRAALEDEIAVLNLAYELSIRNLASARQLEELELARSDLKTESELREITRQILVGKKQIQREYQRVQAHIDGYRYDAERRSNADLALNDPWDPLELGRQPELRPQEHGALELDDVARRRRSTSAKRGRNTAVTSGAVPRSAIDLQHLQLELSLDRRAAEAADIVLDNEYRRLRDTPGQPGTSSSTPTSARLAEIEQERALLRTYWQERLQARLEATRQRLRDLQSAGGRQHEATAEDDLRGQIALLEREIQAPFL
jgi:hypothetical protein